ncbi:hypothetical protein NG819_14705 [Pseudarthrobacter sp. Fe7]|nr:hypothetical protein NG819_14705 [Pseudarthrobacter sp. Fe7]
MAIQYHRRQVASYWEGAVHASSSGNKGLGGGDRIQATLVFESLE